MSAGALLFPRTVPVAGRRIHAYRFFLYVGLYAGVLVSAAAAQGVGASPLRIGFGSLLCATMGLLGARVYHLGARFRSYPPGRFWAEAWNPRRGGMGVLGGLLMVPFSFPIAAWIEVPPAVFWDCMVLGIVFGGVPIRFGCVCNGCCRGRVTRGRFGLPQHDVRGVVERRIPVQWLEIGWWLTAAAVLLWLWPDALPSGSYALAGLGWYGLGRLWQEPLRERQALVLGRIRLDQVVAALLAVSAVAGLLLLTGGS